MKRIINLIENLKKSDVKRAVDSRIKEFSRRKKEEEIFKELCFCILTANFDAERTIRIEKEIGNGFLLLPEKQLAEKLILGFLLLILPLWILLTSSIQYDH